MDLLLFESLTLKGLKDENLSDLKYLPNLKSLMITDMYVDAQQLQFNQNIKDLTMKNVNLYNTFYLPNTIESLQLVDSTVIDTEFMIPYQVKELNIDDVIFNNLNIKNPQKVKRLKIFTWSLLDLAWIKDCTNLERIDIQRSPNIKNAQFLEDFIPKCKIILDDYNVISIPTTILEKIYKDKNKLVSESKRLDSIANTLLEENESEEDKVKAITIYLIKKYRYDKQVVKNNKETTKHGTDATVDLVQLYNQKPIYYALNQEEIICINYACLFSALANRMGLTNYQYESEHHTWNEVEINGEKN